MIIGVSVIWEEFERGDHFALHPSYGSSMADWSRNFKSINTYFWEVE